MRKNVVTNCWDCEHCAMADRVVCTVLNVDVFDYNKRISPDCPHISETPDKIQYRCPECNSLSWKEHLLKDNKTYLCPHCTCEIDVVPF